METVLREVGQCGRFQVCHVTLVQLCRFASAWAQIVMVFGLYDPGWKCIRDNSTSSPFLPSAPESPNINSTLEKTSTGETIVQSLDFTSNYQNKTYANTSTSDVGMCDVINSCVDIEFNTRSSTIVTEFGLVCDKVWIAYIILSVRSLGMLTGSLAWGQIGERFGRTVGLYGSTFVMAVFSALAVFSPTWQVYAANTFFMGFGASAVVPVGSVLCMEFLNSKWRARVSGIPIWNFSIICFALVTFLLRDWRHIHLVTAAISGLSCLGYFWTQESLRWLVIHGKTSQTEKVLDKIAKTNRRPPPGESLVDLLRKRDVVNEDRSRQYTYLDLFRTRSICILTIKLAFAWAVVLSVYDIISFGMQSLPGNFYTNMMVASAIEFPGPLLMGVLSTRAGRRGTGILLNSFGIACCTTIVVALLGLEEGSTRDIIVTSLAFLTRLSAHATMSLLLTYSAELMPTTVRNLAFGFFSIVMRLAGMVGPFLLPRDYVSMIVCFVVLVLAQVVTNAIFFSLAETKNVPLRDDNCG